jgi:hypothetical protein
MVEMARDLAAKPLIAKLGLKPGLKVAVAGVTGEAERRMLPEGIGDVAEVWDAAAIDLDLVLLWASNAHDLEIMAELERSIKRNGSIWVVYPRGSQAIKQSEVMAAGKVAGLVDVKVVRFSETHTALKLVIPLTRRGEVASR